MSNIPSENIAFTKKGCNIKAYALHMWSLSRAGSLLCHICCDTGPQVFFSCCVQQAGNLI